MKNLRLHLFLVASISVLFLSNVAHAQIQFDRPKTEPPLDNPYTMNVPREQILQTVREVLKTCSVQLDEELSKPNEGKLVTKPVMFTRGVTTQNDLEYLATMPASDVRNWLQGRYYLEISSLPLDQKRSQLLITAHIEGRLADVLDNNKWIEGQSNGRLEDEILRGLASKILGVDLSFKKGNNPRRFLNCEY